VTAATQSAKQEWGQAYRALVEVAEPAVETQLSAQIEAILGELRRRVGGTFTLAELADEYGRADVWARHVLSEQGASEWPRTQSLVEGAAFHLYARGAVDYEP
jgi:hypothetical protein